MPGRLQGKVAFITGAGSGIGLACARLFAREGGHVVIAELMPTLGRAAESEILEAALSKAKVDVTMKVIPGAGHGGPQFRTPEIQKLVEDFFAKHLKK